MNWKQLLAVLTLVVAMFSTAIMVSVLYTISGFERLEARIENRMDRLEDKMESQIDQLESKIDQLDNKVDGLSNEVAEIKGALKAKGIMAHR